MHRVKKWMLGILYPARCPMCGKVIGSGKQICPSCHQRLRYLTEPRCKKCGKKLMGVQEYEQEYCYDCSRKKHVFEQGIAVFEYDDLVSQSIYRYKYKNKREYAAFYADAMKRSCERTFADWGVEAVIPVPLYKKKQRMRGFNQSALLANELADALLLPCDTKGLRRIRSTVPQKELNHVARRKNLEHAFAWKAGREMPYKTVLLIDDIYTTGSTIDACAEVLLDAGCEKVYFATISIGRGV